VRATSGYRLVLPPGWVPVPVRDAAPGTAHEVISTAFKKPPDGIPRDAFTSARIELERRLERMIGKARANGGLELFLACGNAYANPVPASFLVAEGSLGDSCDDPLAVVTAIAEGAARDGGKLGQLTALDGAPTARVERISAPEGEDDQAASLRVEYTTPVPSGAGRWMVITFSTLGDGDPAGEYAGLLAELFDAIMSTFRWT
jgi:hypothetical protein